MYRTLGFATFQLQSFDSRDVQSTVGSQVEVTSAMMILDSYLALEMMSTHPNIDINKRNNRLELRRHCLVILPGCH